MGFSLHPSTRARQENKFRTLLRRILPSNQFYATRFECTDIQDVRNIEQLFLQLPLISRNDLMTDQEAYSPFGSNLTLFSIGCVREFQIQFFEVEEKLVIAVELDLERSETVSQIENRMQAWFHMPIHLNEAPPGSLLRNSGKAHRLTQIGQALQKP